MRGEFNWSFRFFFAGKHLFMSGDVCDPTYKATHWGRGVGVIGAAFAAITQTSPII